MLLAVGLVFYISFGKAAPNSCLLPTVCLIGLTYYGFILFIYLFIYLFINYFIIIIFYTMGLETRHHTLLAFGTK